MSSSSSVDTGRMADAIRFLAADAVEKAKSGHPGMPMGMAEIAVALWTRHLRHNPANPQWPGRDRFVLSNGHGSMLQYALLHLTGYDLSLQEIENFRQLHSKTPGHPEIHVTPGVETTTGPLGQGLANAVGMALAEKLLAAEFNRDDALVVDHHTYVFLGDGCLMEGISHEACALAGTWRLGKLIALYDDNGISIDGDVKGWFTDDTAERFRAYGWQVIGPIDGHDVDAVDRAIEQAKADLVQPSLIICRTTIGRGAPTRAGTAKAHGEALGTDELAATRKALGWEYAPFEIPADLYAAWNARDAGAKAESQWNERLVTYRKSHAAPAAEFERRLAGELPANFAELAAKLVADANAKAETVATRKASQYALEALAPAVPEMLGGSADLTHSNLTLWKGAPLLSGGGTGRHISYGVREFGMAAIMNGIALHGGYIPFGGTFLTFSDYSRNAIRMAALMNLRVIHVFTHDSIGLGEDGPTHQSIEQVSSLRLIPNLEVWRPCDTVETAVAWKLALLCKNAPTALALSRQNLPFVPRSEAQIAAIERGGYVLAEADGGVPQRVLIATGSEVGLALAAKKLLEGEGIATRVVSMPSTEAFDRQDAAYRAEVLPRDVRKIAVEAGTTALWWKYVGLDGAVVGIDRFGESAPAGKLFEFFGFTPENVARIAKGE
ncbi:transketolase [Dokdonella sp.]|uniref:transketolase n=1 Tax=Dokdonella sp. TaxID=2291710 RepID=UPI001B231DE3|nr:transketolase [Dokdonella sp.]MBO9661525.1 transketolase [Dokdonella sp.]